MYSNTNMDDPENNRETRVQELQSYYKSLRRAVLGESVDVEEEVADPDRDAFMRASKRNLAAILPPSLPGEESIQRLPA